MSSENLSRENPPYLPHNPELNYIFKILFNKKFALKHKLLFNKVSLHWILIDNDFLTLLSLIVTIISLIAIILSRSSNANEIFILLLSLKSTLIRSYSLMLLIPAYSTMASDERNGNVGQRRTSAEYSESIANARNELNDGYLCPDDVQIPIYF